MKKIPSFSVGLAMFAMFFGAGNSIFPLSVGLYSVQNHFYGMLGLTLTSVVVPILGVVAIVLFEGKIGAFFERMGKAPGLLIAIFVISLLGPLGSAPRCIALSYATMQVLFTDLSLPAFSAFSCALVFFFTLKKDRILPVLGEVLTPILLVLLTVLILAGLLTQAEIEPANISRLDALLYGLKQGYYTMDLLAAFFFSSTILHLLKEQSQKTRSPKKLMFKASFIAAILLVCVYTGLSFLAAFHGSSMIVSETQDLLPQIALKIVGAQGGIWICTTIALACLTTAIALISAFVDFLQKEVLPKNVSYPFLLFLSLAMTFVVSTFAFHGISAFLGPILQICYPAFITLTLCNLLYSIKGMRVVKTPVYAVLLITCYQYFFS